MSSTSAAISALVDNQATDLDLARLLKQLENPAAQQKTLAKWRNYHLASSVLRGELPPGQAQKFSQLDISARMASFLADETKLTAKASLKTQWLKTTGLAASVALVVLVGAQTYNLLPFAGKAPQNIGIQPPVAQQVNNPAASSSASQQVSFTSCQPTSIKNLTKPSYVVEASRLEKQPCKRFPAYSLTSSNLAQNANYTPVNAP